MGCLLIMLFFFICTFTFCNFLVRADKMIWLGVSQHPSSKHWGIFCNTKFTSLSSLITAFASHKLDPLGTQRIFEKIYERCPLEIQFWYVNEFGLDAAYLWDVSATNKRIWYCFLQKKKLFHFLQSLAV